MFQKILYKFKEIQQAKAVILMYHQVCERKTDPWELAVHPDHFHAQLDYLKKNFNVVSMAELADGVVNHKVKKTVAITFDDGLKDNYTNAAPLLDYHNLPATFYVATTAMKQEQAYWWDALQDVIFESDVLPAAFDMVIADKAVRFTFTNDPALTPKVANQIRAWNYNLPIPNERVALYMLLWQHIKPLASGQQNEVVVAVRQWAGHKALINTDAVTMAVREMQMLSENPLFTIGAHSVNHAMLSHQTPGDQAYEVKESKSQIERWLGKPVDGFAYPYGNYDSTTQTILKEAGFKYAVSTEQKAVTCEDDPFALPRIQVKNWCVYEFATKLNDMVND